ncbi:MAG TPA: KpsF/GutQ family sugar-phosphate isomerase [Candidatus Binatia bacterium]|jgi:arabinose-5-phosphate isomerase|nr:KpsF/GutQ family sugar-phosphate isomerase [Candidatus Binatia bacterium]
MTDRARILALAERVLRLEAESIVALCPRLDERFVTAVELMRSCRGRVVVAGMGKSGLVGRKIAATLASTGTPAYFLHPAEGVHGDLGILGRDDVVLGLSNSGETDEMLGVLPQIKRLGVPLILLTGNPRSTLARQSDVVLDVAVREEACPMNLAPTSSTTAALALGDALAMALLDLRGLRPEDYAALHPGGTLGWRALFRVADLMHTGEAVPAVRETSTLRQAIEEMTAKRLGMTTVVDAGGRLVGVITDGDLRRRQLAGESALAGPAAEAMTRTPRIVDGDDLATRAIGLMETYAITSLVIVDAEGRPVGIIHLHDILRSKIV